MRLDFSVVEGSAAPPACPKCRKLHDVTGLGRWANLTRNALCPACEVLEAAERRLDAEQAWKAQVEAAWRAICPPLYAATDPARLPVEALDALLGWQWGPMGLLAIGPTGRGKTRAMWLLIHRLLDEGRTVKTFDCAAFGHECGRRFLDGTGAEWVDGLAKVETVFLDDLGKVPMTERVEAELFALIERRTANMLPILASSNLVGRDFEGKASADRGAPMVRRLREFCRVVVF